MTPIQTFGATQAPSNMMFPTAAYLQASQNAAETRARGMEAMGKGIASGISSVAGAYKEYKDDEAKFNATKKMYKLFGGSLDEETRKEFDSFFADTSLSIREKNAASPAIMQFLGAAQQQKGRERVAEIMADSRLDVANARNPPPRPRPQFDATQGADPYSYPANPPKATFVAEQSNVPYMIQRQPDQPQPMQQQPRGKLPRTRWNDTTKKMEFLNPQGTRYIEEPDDELMFGSDLRITPF